MINLKYRLDFSCEKCGRELCDETEDIEFSPSDKGDIIVHECCKDVFCDRCNSYMTVGLRVIEKKDDSWQQGICSLFGEGINSATITERELVNA